MGRFGDVEEGPREVERTPYYGGKVEYWRRVSKRGVVLNWINFAMLFVVATCCVLLKMYAWAIFELAAASIALIWAIVCHRKYLARSVTSKVFLYDMMSAYPKAMMEPVKDTTIWSTLDDVTSRPMPWWTCKGCGRVYPLTPQDPYWSSEFCKSECQKEKKP